MASNESLRKLALGLLELSKRFLKADKYLEPMAFIVTKKEHYPRPLEFQDDTRKENSCQRVVEEARAKHASAIVTIFTARSKEFTDQPFDKKRYVWGQLQSEASQRCILLTVTGPRIRSWVVEVPFEEKADQIILGEPKEYDQNEVALGLFAGWSVQDDSKHTS